MTEAGSPIKDFYPLEFKLDLNGKMRLWQAVVLLPFIDEKRLLEAIKPLEHTLKPEEVRRNRPGPHVLFVHQRHPAAPQIVELEEDPAPVPATALVPRVPQRPVGGGAETSTTTGGAEKSKGAVEKSKEALETRANELAAEQLRAEMSGDVEAASSAKGELEALHALQRESRREGKREREMEGWKKRRECALQALPRELLPLGVIRHSPPTLTATYLSNLLPLFPNPSSLPFFPTPLPLP